jgi:RNA polymerase sigma-70 factor (ECF subfamily)
MPEPSFHTANLQRWLADPTDPAARDELLRAAWGRLEALTRRMLRKYPGVARWAETGDVLNAAAVRLLRALEGTRVADTRGFLNLSAAVIRRELIDLARHFHGPHGVGANHHSAAPDAVPPEAVDPAPPAEELELWSALHAAVDALPPEPRETFGLRFYHRWSEAQIAELFGVDERTVRRRWRAACAALKEALGELPEVGDD